MNLKRCDENSPCENCNHVLITARLVMPNPPFKHANTQDVRMWNQCLADYPCLAWNEEQREQHYESLRGLAEDVRPRIQSTP